jgi:hypothetical protein
LNGDIVREESQFNERLEKESLGVVVKSGDQLMCVDVDLDFLIESDDIPIVLEIRRGRVSRHHVWFVTALFFIGNLILTGMYVVALLTWKG